MPALPHQETIEQLLFFRKELDRIFRSVSETDGSDATEGPEILVDMVENAKEITIHVEVPGSDLEDIELYVNSDILLIEGTKKQPPGSQPEGEGNQRRYLYLERSFGRFRRVIELPKAGDTRHIQAHITHGVLLIHLPKITERRGQRRRIEINQQGPQ